MTVVLATDFSPSSEKARVVAARLCRRSGDALVIAHVLEGLPPGVLVGPGFPGEMLEQMRVAAKDEMDRQVAALRAEGLQVTPELMSGFAPDEVARVARERDARVIVLGSHGRSFAGRLLAGSVADAVASAADRPVLVVRGEAPSLAADVAPTRLKVLLALDASHAGAAAVAFVRELREHGPVDVVVAHCYWPPGEYQRLGLTGPGTFTEADPEVVRVIERELRERLGALAGEGETTFRIAPSLGRPADPLSRWAVEEGADLIVVGTHGRHGLSRLWHGSVARDLLHVSAVPVVCAPSAAIPPEPEVIPQVDVVVVGTDLSPLGDRAVLQAFGAVQPGGRVEVTYVHERHLPVPSYAYEPGTPSLEAAERGRIEEKLRALVPAGAERRGVAARVQVVEARTAGDGLLQHAERTGASLIVVGSHGRTGALARLMGSTAEAVLRASRRPVLMVPAER